MTSWCAHFSAAYAPGPAGPPGRDGRDGLPGICLKDINSLHQIAKGTLFVYCILALVTPNVWLLFVKFM